MALLIRPFEGLATAVVRALSSLAAFIGRTLDRPGRRARRTARKLRRDLMRAREERRTLTPKEREAWLGGFEDANAAFRRAEAAARGAVGQPAR